VISALRLSMIVADKIQSVADACIHMGAKKKIREIKRKNR